MFLLQDRLCKHFATWVPDSMLPYTDYSLKAGSPAEQKILKEVLQESLRESVKAEFKKTGSQGECRVALHQNIRKAPTAPTGRRGFKPGPECKQATETFDLSAFKTTSTLSSSLKRRALEYVVKALCLDACVANRVWDSVGCWWCQSWQTDTEVIVWWWELFSRL